MHRRDAPNPLAKNPSEIRSVSAVSTPIIRLGLRGLIPLTCLSILGCGATAPENDVARRPSPLTAPAGNFGQAIAQDPVNADPLPIDQIVATSVPHLLSAKADDVLEPISESTGGRSNEGTGDFIEVDSINAATGDSIEADSINAATGDSIEADSTNAATGTAFISWMPPLETVDGSSFNGISGYRIDYGRQPEALDQSIQIENPGISSYLVENLEPGTWYFRIVAIDLDGQDSRPTGVGTKTIS